MMTTTLVRSAPHLVVETPEKRYSHTSQAKPDTSGLVMAKAATFVNEITHFGGQPEPVSSSAYGVLEGIVSPDERPYRALKEAMAATAQSYDIVAASWNSESAAWADVNPAQACSTIVVAMHDALGRLVDDSLVLIRDEVDGTIGGVAASILTNQPIRNVVSPSVLSYYVNYSKFHAVHPHSIYAEAKTDSAYVSYDLKVQSPLSDGANPDSHVVAVNEVTYIEVVAKRDAGSSFRFYAADDPTLIANYNKPYPPFFSS